MKNSWRLINLNKRYLLKAGNRIFRCQIGSKGLKSPAKKVEGDKSTPFGKWNLEGLYYRPDRNLRPKLKNKNTLKIYPITKNCGWCDDIKSKNYNKFIKINKCLAEGVSHEKLWRDDNVYDLLLELSHNKKPTISNKGSAIFIHCSFLDNRSTAGCVAIKKGDLIFLINNIRNRVQIII